MAGNMPKEEAMRNYIEELQKVCVLHACVMFDYLCMCT